MPKVDVRTPAEKARATARWARTMTKWYITHSSKGGVKWQLIDFNGPRGQESAGIVDMIAIRKNHKEPKARYRRGDLFEIVLVQVKGGNARFPTEDDVARILSTMRHHRADKAILAEWKKGEKLCVYKLPDMVRPVDARRIFGAGPRIKPRHRAESK